MAANPVRKRLLLVCSWAGRRNGEPDADPTQTLREHEKMNQEDDEVAKVHDFNLGNIILIGTLIFIFVLLAIAFLPYPNGGGHDGKGAVSVSHTKQMSLAAAMYAADYDGYLPLGTAWHTGKDQLCFPAPAGCFSTWAWEVQAYLKTSGLFNDPTTERNPRRADGQDRFDTLFTQYGYNYAFLSPYRRAKSSDSSNQRVIGVSLTAATNAANTVMVASKWTRVNTPMVGFWGTGIPGGMLADAGLEPPVCSNLKQLCLSNWGKNEFFDQANPANGILLTNREGRFTGGVAGRAKGDQAIVGFLDGHSKKLTYVALARGTNWTPTIEASAVVVTDSKEYLWNVVK